MASQFGEEAPPRRGSVGSRPYAVSITCSTSRSVEQPTDCVNSSPRLPRVKHRRAICHVQFSWQVSQGARADRVMPHQIRKFMLCN